MILIKNKSMIFKIKVSTKWRTFSYKSEICYVTSSVYFTDPFAAKNSCKYCTYSHATLPYKKSCTTTTHYQHYYLFSCLHLKSNYLLALSLFWTTIEVSCFSSLQELRLKSCMTNISNCWIRSLFNILILYMFALLLASVYHNSQFLVISAKHL